MITLAADSRSTLRLVRWGVRSVLIAALALVFVTSAAAGWSGRDPARNTRIGSLPSSCDSAPTGLECINAGVYYLDRARANAGLPPYALPANFPSLSPPRQIFILVNLDRIQYGLAPIPGMTAALNRDALVTGVWRGTDPHVSSSRGLKTVWPGWAGAFYNAPMAYEGWVWDDGLGSNNPRCTPYDHSRCWGHRHSVLWQYGSVSAMGAAAGRGGSRHQRGYSYIFVGGTSAYHPAYTYTWDQAVADGAGTNAYDPGPGPAAMCHVPAVIGMSLIAATRAITRAHCAVGAVIKRHSNYPAGFVTQQHPNPALTFAGGKKMRLTVSLGR